MTIETTWHDKTTTVSCDGGPSSATGVASGDRLIGNATSGSFVQIDVTIRYGGQTWSLTTGFTPQ